jgi:short-subunit dehydrogenase
LKTIWQKAIVVGGTGGIGEPIVSRLVAEGCEVAVVSKNQEKLERLRGNLGLAENRIYAYDLVDIEHAQDAFDAIVQTLGGIDLLVYAAGIMPQTGPTEYCTARDAEIIRINLVAAIAWCNAAAKRFERARSGTILAIGSPSGDRGRRGNPAYGASKAGLENYLESLRNRLAQHHVSVVTAKPGPVKTQMTSHLGKIPGMIEAEDAADVILRKAQGFSRSFYVPSKWWVASRIMRMIPSFIFRKLKI